jgi:epoxide hydrolase-like predicted phosphatase
VKALLVDYGGVLTADIESVYRSFSSAEGLAPDAILRLLREDGGALAETHALEVGELAEEDFEHRFAGRLGLEPSGLLGRLAASLGRDEAMIAAVRRARSSNVPTALVSNSWGLTMYDRGLLAELFDAVVLSGEVGMRKPDERMFLLAAERLGVEPDACVVVDDFPWNCTAAEAVGMHAVLHRETAGTLAALERLLELELRPPAPRPG